MALSMGNTGHAAARRAHWGWALAALGCAAFGLMAIEFSVALRADDIAWWARVQAIFTGDAYSFGAGSAHTMYPVYQRALAAMSSHTALGGLALTFGALQFVPALRRRHPRLHRALGACVIAGVVVSMVGALIYLARTPLGEIYASPAFGLALWSLALACLLWLTLAVLAAQRRDFRSHMGFMALMMATLLSAPILRLEWAAFGVFSAYDMRQVNQVVVPSLLVLCNLAMTAWMHGVGVRDLPARSPALLPGAALLRVNAWLAVAVIAHEALLAPLGADALGTWRDPAARLPASAALWGLPALALAWRAPGELARLVAGRGASGHATPLTLAAALGALALAAQQPVAGVDALGLRYYWAFLGLALPALLLAARRSARADQPWSIVHTFLALAPGAWPLLWLIGHACDQPYVVAMWFAATVGLAAMSAHAFLTAYGIRLPVGAR